jgi:hypothetical protein
MPTGILRALDEDGEFETVRSVSEPSSVVLYVSSLLFVTVLVLFILK